jgi:septal ring factor EnvC (AmiA/AmiB activator)
LQADINNNQKSLNLQGNLLKKRLRVLQRISKGNDALLIIIGGEDISQTLRTLRYISDISTYDYRLINKYKETVRVLSEKQNNLKKLSSELKTEEGKLTKLEGSLKEKKKERESLLVSVRKEKKTYEKMIKELQEASNRLMKIIQESERRESDLRKKKGTRPGIKEDETVEDSGFARLKGKLSWPVNGTVAIQYGTQVDPLFNLPVFRSGIHIKTSNGASVKAVHEGKVVFADDFKGYGQLVIIGHGGGYHTLYGNLSKIFLKNGAIIKEHTTIGEVGESSTIGASGLYFEIRYKGKPLDPQQWLKK